MERPLSQRFTGETKGINSSIWSPESKHPTKKTKPQRKNNQPTLYWLGICDRNSEISGNMFWIEQNISFNLQRVFFCFFSLELLKGSYVIKQVWYSVLSKPACPELLQVPSNGVQAQSENYWLSEHHSGQIWHPPVSEKSNVRKLEQNPGSLWLWINQNASGMTSLQC